MKSLLAVGTAILLTLRAGAVAGPYSLGLNDPANAWDAPIPGFVGPDGDGKATLLDGQGGLMNARNGVSRLFFGWASGYASYLPSDAASVDETFGDPQRALGPVTGDNFDIVSLGDLDAGQLTAGVAPGRITLTFGRKIEDKPGADFAVFENGLTSAFNTGGAGAGGVFAELAYVEVSSDGLNFARFPSASLTAASVGGYGSIDPTNVFGLAGKHVNAYGDCWGTPFDLARLANDPLVTGGTVDLNAIRWVRLVDIPGKGAFLDSAGRPIFDSWLTFGSGGFDLEAVGVISQEITFDEWQTLQGLTGAQRGAAADPDGDGIVNLLEYAFSLSPLAPDANGRPALVPLGDRVGISFTRDTRKTDLTYEVQASGDLVSWAPIARSRGGAALAGVAPYAPALTDASASAIASVGVIRRESVADVVSAGSAPRRFLRVRVTQTAPAAIPSALAAAEGRR